MYRHATEVSNVVRRMEAAFTPLLSRMFIPDIFVTVGARLLTTFKQLQIKEKLILIINLQLKGMCPMSQ